MSSSSNPNPNPSEQQAFNEGANFWHYDVGVPTIPGEYKTKKPCVFWEGYQQKPPAEEEHKRWLNEGKYSGGVFVLCGTPCYSKDKNKTNLFLVGVDIDRQKGIDAFCTRKGKTISLRDFAAQTVVEQREDAPDRCHAFFYSPIKFPVKRPDEILGIEVKSSWEHGVMRVAPSITEGGHPVKIIGTPREPVILNEQQATDLLQHINHICIENGVEYLQKGNDSNNNTFLTPELKQVIKSQDVSFASKDKVKIPSRYRNVTLISVANSILSNHLDNDRTNEESLREFFFAINTFLCKPPLSNSEAEVIWEHALDWMWPRILNEIVHGTRARARKGAKTKEEEEEEEAEQEQRKKTIIDELVTEYDFKTLADSYPKEEIWFYDKTRGVFANNGEVIIKARLESEFGLEISNKGVNEVLGHIQRSTYFDRNGFNPDIAWIGSLNCMINLKTGETAPFSPDFLNTTYIPVKYSPQVECPKIMQFLHDIMEPEDIEIVLDFMAYCLWRDYKFANWLLFVGYGHNGKSVLLNLIERFLGKQNTSSESLERLLKRTFAPASLYHKLANIDADVSGDILIENTGVIKKLTGNDESPAEFKYKTQFKFRNYAKLIFSCNEIPETNDKTDAFFRRLIIINFTQQFLAERDDPYILEKICTEEEFSGLLNELLRRLPRVISQGIRPTTNETMRDTYEKYQAGSNPVEYFREKVLMATDESGAYVRKEEMFHEYIVFCKAKKIAPESEWSFDRELKAMRFIVKRFRKGSDRFYGWAGVKIVNWKEEEEKEQQTFEDLPT